MDANGRLETLKLVSEAQEFQPNLTFVAVGNGVLNEVSPLDCHAFSNVTFVAAAVPSCAPAGNDVRAVQDFHAFEKLAQLLMSISPNELSEVHEFQA